MTQLRLAVLMRRRSNLGSLWPEMSVGGAGDAGVRVCYDAL